MEIPVLAESAGTITTMHVAEGDVVQEGDLIAEIRRLARRTLKPRWWSAGRRSPGR